MTAGQRVDGGGANDLWHYAVGSERKGPVPRPTIAKLLASGEISAETYVWQPGMDNWVHLGDAPTLKPLVAGLDGDGSPEEFVEEDTAFTSPAEIAATHTQLDEDDGQLTGDTIVDARQGSEGVVEDVALDEILEGPSTQETPIEEVAGVLAEDTEPQPVFAAALEPEPQAKRKLKPPTPTNRMAAIGSPNIVGAAGAVDPVDALLGVGAGSALTSDADSGLLGPSVASSTTGASSASGSDIFSIGGGSTSGGGGDDIFASSEPTAEAEEIAGVHGRRQSSVLFSLDELGRDESARGTHTGGNEQFLTDSSGLIDIKAIASDKQSKGNDPLGAAAPSLTLSAPAAPNALTIPIVERRRNMGPWILAAAALVIVGGVAIALIASGGDDPAPTPPPATVASSPPAKPETPVVADKGESPKPTTGDQVAKTGDSEAKPGEGTDPEAEGADPKAEGADPKAEGEGQDEVAKTDGGDPEAEGTNPEGDAKDPKVAAADDKSAAATTDEKPKPEARKPTTRKPTTRTPKPARTETRPTVVVEPAKPTPSNAGNTAKVNDLLRKLDSGEKPASKPTPAADSSLPNKLSAATVRNTIRGRFGRCGGMIANADGSVTVQTQFVISSSGVVQSARVSNGGGTSPDVQRCVVSVIKQTTFAKFKQPTMQVNLPVRLL